MKIHLFVPGLPIAQPRYGKGKNDNAYIPKLKSGAPHPIHAWKELLRIHYNMIASPSVFPLTGPAIVSLEFIFPRPRNVPKAQYYKITKPDIDNLTKAVFEPMSGCLVKDDNQICDGRRWKRYGATPGVGILIQDEVSAEDYYSFKIEAIND